MSKIKKIRLKTIKVEDTHSWRREGLKNEEISFLCPVLSNASNPRKRGTPRRSGSLPNKKD